MKSHIAIWIIVIFFINLARSQSDSIVVDDNLVLLGTIKKVDKGVITIKTEFSKNNIRVERERIKSISTQNQLMLTDRYGTRNSGTIEGSGRDSIFLTTDENEILAYHWDDLFNMEEYKNDFMDRFSFRIDLGFSMAQANNLVQWSSNGSIGYKADNWALESAFNGIISSQDNSEKIYRWEQQIEFSSYLPKNWFLHSELGFLTSSEQKIDSRFVPRLGVGKILVRLNEVNWSIIGGGNMNFEKFMDNPEERRTIEVFFGMDLNIVELGNLNISNRNSIFKSVTETDRWRADSAIDFRYKLPLKLYLSTGFTYNYDSSPTSGADGTDYLLRVGVGWEL